MKPKIVATLNLTETDVKILLEALGQHQQFLWNQRQNSKATQIMIDRIYRAMGIRLDRVNG